MRPLPEVRQLVAAGGRPGEIFTLLAHWALLAVPTADGTCLVAQSPGGIIAGSAGLDDAAETARGGSFVAACPPIVTGGNDIGTLHVSVRGAGCRDTQFQWRAGLAAAVLSHLVAATLDAVDWSSEPRPTRRPGASPAKTVPRCGTTSCGRQELPHHSIWGQ